MCHGAQAQAQARADVLDTHSVTTWTGASGFTFGDTNTIAQDTTGYLWLGTSLGLVRFDGVRFVPWRIAGVPLDTFVTALLTARDGTLWVAVPTGVVSIRDQRATLYEANEGFQAGLVGRFAEDEQGSIWARGPESVWRFRAGRWEELGRDDVLPAVASALSDDQRGALPASVRERLNFGPVSEVLRDTGGAFWVGTAGQGLLRLPPAEPSSPPVQQITRRDGLAANSVRALFEDRERNIWVGLAGGLTRISEKKITTVAEGEAVSAIVATGDGSTWVGTSAGVIRVLGERQRRYTEADGLPSGIIRALYGQRDGALWVSTSRGIARFADGRFVPVATPEGARLQRVTGMTAGGDGTLWITDLNEGLFRFSNGALTRIGVPDLPRPTSVYADSAGRLWLGQLDGDLAMYKDGIVSFHTAADGSDIGTVLTIVEDSFGRIWIGTTTGLGCFENGHFVREDIEDLASGVLAVVEDARQHLWIATRAGIISARLAAADVVRQQGPKLTDFRVYDIADGLPGVAVRAYPSGTAGTDASIWLATANGAARLVPAQLTEPEAPPTIRIEAMVADNREVEPVSGVALSPGTSHIAIEYTVLSLTSAASSRFWYRLDGFDSDWVRAGLRREAVYTNLPPGQYRFRVMSRGGGGPQQEAALDFSIQPEFYQTTAFTVAMAGLVILLISAAWRLRLVRVRDQFKLVLMERARIAREIHDTLLQGLFGVALQVDGISRQLDSPAEETRARLEGLRRLVSGYIRETRSSIWLLRSPSLEQHDLPAAIREAAETLTAGAPVQLDFRVVGNARRLPADVEEPLLRIAHEAVMNVVKHAHASRVTIALDYSADAVSLRVTDDGLGFDTERSAAPAAARWGLAGMTERAAQMGARLTLSSARGRGTELQLVVPAEAV